MHQSHREGATRRAGDAGVLNLASEQGILAEAVLISGSIKHWSRLAVTDPRRCLALTAAFPSTAYSPLALQ